MNMQSRRELALTMLVYGVLLSRTHARTICSCYNRYQSHYNNRPIDTVIHSHQCDACRTEAPVTDTCDYQHATSLGDEHLACGGQPAPLVSYRCDLEEGVYTCRIPRRLYRCGMVALPFYSSILLKHLPSNSSLNRSSTPLVLLNNVLHSTVSLGNGCSKTTVCFNPQESAQRIITLSITGSPGVIVNDVIATVFYYNRCHQMSRPSAINGFPINIPRFNPVETASIEDIERLQSG